MQTEKKACITVAQLFSMLFVSRLVVSITYSGAASQNANIWDYLISSGISFLLTFLLVVPVYILFCAEPSKSIAEVSCSLLGKPGRLVPVIYGIYFIIVCTHTLTVFINFVSNVINPPISTIILSLGVVLASCYGASKGLEGIARASSLILFGIVVSGIFIVISLLGSVEKENYTPLLYDGAGSMWRGVMYMLSHMSGISAMAMLMGRSKGNVKKGIVFWNVSLYLMIALVIVLMVGSLGSFLQTQLFPLYTAVSVSRIGSLRNLDALYLGIWTMGIFIKISLFILMTMDCCSSAASKKISGKASLIIGGIVFVLSVCFSRTEVYSLVFNSWSLLAFMLVTSAIIPILILFARKLKTGKRGGKVEN